MKKHTKALIGIITAASLTVGAVSMIFNNNPEADAKNASFNGIENLIKTATEENPFTVVELVPHESMAKFGYFVEGNEPENWLKELPKLDSKEKRMTYMATLKTKLSPISSADRTKPLTYTEYKEAYSLDGVSTADEAMYSSFELETPIVFKKGKAVGYKMVDSPGGSFRFDAAFTEQAGGDYDENVASYEYSDEIDGRYAVKFKKIDTSRYDGSIVYSAAESRLLSSTEEIKVLDGIRYVYRKTKGASGAGTVYEFALSNKDVNGYSFNFDSYDYVLLSFTGVDVATLTPKDKTAGAYYAPESAEYTNLEAEYDGILNSVEPYKKIASGQGHFAISVEESYVYVGKGLGSKKLVEVAGGKLDHDLVIDRVFYTGGFKNNNWFENGVFLKNFSDNNYLSTTNPDYNRDKMKIKVITLTPAGINAELAANPNYFSNVGLLYIVATNSLVGNSEPYKYRNKIDGDSSDIGTDISPEVFAAIKRELDTNHLPIVVENYGKAYSSATNMLDLAKELVTKRKIFDGKEDTDGHFVKKSVYVIEKDFQNQTPEIFKNFATDFINKNSSDSDFVNEAKEVGFGEVAESIIEENNIVDKGVEGTTDNTKRFELKISKARALEYIISYKMKRKKTTDDVVKILDIEPAKVVGQKEKDSDRITEKVKKWFGTSKPINHTSETQPTTEFIGRTKELSDYDLIYIGLDTSSFNTVTETRKVTSIVPSKNVPPEWVEGEWITEKIVADKPVNKVEINSKTETVPGTTEKYTIPGYTIPGYTIPKTTTHKVQNNKNYYWRPPYVKPAYDVPGYRIPVSPFSENVVNYPVYNDSNMNGLVYSNVGDIYQDNDPGQGYMGGLMDTDYNKIGELIDKYKNYANIVGLSQNDKNNYEKQYSDKPKELYNNIEAYKDVAPNADGIKLNYNEDAKEKDYHFNGEYDNKTSVEWTGFRFPGNDLTDEKLRKLKEYIKLGYPVVFADGFVNRQGGLITANEVKIDNSSRMYELVNFAIDFRKKNPSRKNVIFEGENERLDPTELNSLITNINLPKPELFMEKPIYEKDIDIPDRETAYTLINNRTLEINFKLLNKGFESENAKFKLSLYIDSNSDGKFSGKREIIADYYYDVFKDNIIHKGELKASQTSWYKVSYKLPNQFVGVIPWKIKVELVNSNGSKRHTSATGMGYAKRTGVKKKINVLQIKSAEYIKNKLSQHYSNNEKKYRYNNSQEFLTVYERNLYLGDPYNATKLNNNVPKFYYYSASTFDMGTDPVFKELLSKVGDFEITVDSVEGYDYIDKYDKWWQKNKNTKRPEDFFNEFELKTGTQKQYDMLVLGFADAYQLPNVKGCLEPILGFIKAGKPVLMTHDCTSLVNYRGANAWNYDLNRMIRGEVGLDRYGILNNWALRVGVGADKNDTEMKYDKHFYPTVNLNAAGDSITSSELYDLAIRNAEGDKKHKKDIAYRPRSNRTRLVKEVQGNTYGNLFLSTWTKYKEKYPHIYESQKRMLKNMEAFKRSDRVEQINEGQITTYPYKINEVIDVAETHYQPYQLDLNEDDDEDGESDLIVWYTLMSPKDMANNPLHAYNLNPKDIRNHYYIYTKGNITYSGVGHSKVTGREEMKLYVNTLIAAYKAVTVPPTIEFKETASPDATDKKVSYISYDVSSDARNNGVVTGEREKVYFTPVDYNGFVKNIDPNKTRVLVKPMASNSGLYNVFKTNGIKENVTTDKKYGNCYELMPGERYYFEVPISELSGNTNKIEIEVKAKTRLLKTHSNSTKTTLEYSAEGESTYTIQKRGLFDLD